VKTRKIPKILARMALAYDKAHGPHKYELCAKDKWGNYHALRAFTGKTIKNDTGF